MFTRSLKTLIWIIPVYNFVVWTRENLTGAVMITADLDNLGGINITGIEVSSCY